MSPFFCCNLCASESCLQSWRRRFRTRPFAAESQGKQKAAASGQLKCLRTGTSSFSPRTALRTPLGPRVARRCAGSSLAVRQRAPGRPVRLGRWELRRARCGGGAVPDAHGQRKIREGFKAFLVAGRAAAKSSAPQQATRIPAAVAL